MKGTSEVQGRGFIVAGQYVPVQMERESCLHHQQYVVPSGCWTVLMQMLYQSVTLKRELSQKAKLTI